MRTGACYRHELARGKVMKIVVIGGAGLIGSKVVARLKQKGHDALAAAPNTGVNTITGDGLKDAMAGAQVVVDLPIRLQLKTRRCWNSSRLPSAIFFRRRPQRASGIMSRYQSSELTDPTMVIFVPKLLKRN